MPQPALDWQFWTVTAAAAVAVWMLVKPFVGSKKKNAASPCSLCTAAGPPCRSGGGRDRRATIDRAR